MQTTKKELMDELSFLRTELSLSRERIHKLENELKARLDASMLNSRIDIARSLSLLTESLSKAIYVVVGKEVL